MSPAGDRQPIFSSIAAAVADAQEKLDARPMKGGPSYAIPRAQAELTFRMQFDAERRVFFIFRRQGASSRSAQRLRFSVLAAPERPAPAPELPVRLELRVPPYLLPMQLEQEIGEAAEQLGGGSPGPAGGADTGLVCFRLAGFLHYLVVRVAGHHKSDAIRVFFPDIPEASAFPRLHYAPYRELFETLRAAQREPAPLRYPYKLGAEVGWGWDRFDEFLVHLWDGYRDAMNDLSSRQPGGDPPVFYFIDNFQGDFFYSAWKARSDHPVENSFDADADWIHNRVAVQHDTTHGCARIELLAPEFLLSGKVRTKLLGLLLPHAKHLAEKCSDLGDTPVDASELEHASPGVLILLSYEDKPPTKGFLAVWPTSRGELLFTFDSDGEKLTDGPDAHDFIPSDAADAARLREGAHEVIHNFFRAIRLWRTREIIT